MDQTILAVDDSGNFLEYIPKETGHTGAGQRHLAITVLIYNSKGQVLLQRRKHQIFDNIWDFTGATHPLHKPHLCHSEERSDVGILINELSSSSNKDCHALRARNDRKCKLCKQDGIDETLEEATQRCLEVEYGIKEKIPFKNLGFFNYFAPYHTVQGDFCENEHCVLMTGEYNGEVKMDPGIGYEYKWMNKEDFLNDIKSNPQKYAPWVLEGVKILQQVEFPYGLDKQV